MVRHNDYDRAPLSDMSPVEVDAFYRLLPTLVSSLRDPQFANLFRMDVGTMIVIDNHRVMHGRKAFEGSRNLVGCYINKDDFLSTRQATLEGDEFGQPARG